MPSSKFPPRIKEADYKVCLEKQKARIDWETLKNKMRLAGKTSPIRY